MLRIRGSAALLRRDVRVRLDLVRDDHQEVVRRAGAQADDALGLGVLARGPELLGVVAQQLLHVEDRLGVELL